MKDALADASLLFHPKPAAPTSIMTDASDKAVGAILQQYVNSVWRPIAYFSRKLKPAELLAIYLAIKHFRHFVEGRSFCVLTDHKPLTFALTSHSSSHSPRQARHLDFIAQFTSDIRHVKGTDNPVADALSLLDVDALAIGELNSINLEQMATAQQQDQEIQHLLTSPQFLLLDHQNPFHCSHRRLHCCVTFPRVYHDLWFPVPYVRIVFCVLHFFAHPGIRATQHLIVARFVWPHVNTDVRNWTRSCLQCQQVKV